MSLVPCAVYCDESYAKLRYNDLIKMTFFKIQDLEFHIPDMYRVTYVVYQVGR